MAGLAALAVGTVVSVAAQRATHDFWAEEKLSRIEQRLRREPRNGVLHMKRACALRDAGRLGEAAAAADTALALEPQDARIYHNRGRIAELRHNGELAVRMYRKALLLDPRLHESREALALLLCKTGQRLQGASMLDSLVAQQPQNQRLRQNAAVAALQLGQPSRAVALCRADGNAGMSPRERDILYTGFCDLADSVLMRGDAGRGIMLADSAIAVSPGTARAYVLRARGALKLNRLDAAESFVREALQIDDADCDGLAILSQVLARRGLRVASDSVSAATEAACARALLSSP